MGKLIIKNRYGQVPNELLNNKDISFKAKGLFAFLQSKPPNWNFSKERIAGQTKEGLTSVKSAFKELKDNGYLRTKSIKDDKGQWAGYDYILDDRPTVRKTEGTKTAPSDNHTAFSKKDYSKKEYSNKEDTLQSPFHYDCETSSLKGNKDTNEHKIQTEPYKEDNTKNSSKELKSTDGNKQSSWYLKEIENLINSDKYYMSIIGELFNFKGKEFKDEAELQKSIGRNVRASKNLIGYPRERILKTFSYLDKDVKKRYNWGLETILKTIDYIK